MRSNLIETINLGKVTLMDFNKNVTLLGIIELYQYINETIFFQMKFMYGRTLIPQLTAPLLFLQKNDWLLTHLESINTLFIHKLCYQKDRKEFPFRDTKHIIYHWNKKGIEKAIEMFFIAAL